MATNKTATKPTEAPGTAVGPTRSTGLVAQMAARFNVDADKMLTTLKQTAFRAVGKDYKPIEISNEQMMALLVVADQYGLNPWTKEIYAFPDKSGGIVPVIGVDGWIRMINEHPQFKSMELAYPPGLDDDVIPNWIECTICRKDRDKPTVIREYYAEAKRNTDPWNQMPRRMLRHKAIIQCGRVAFGFSGMHDPDEAERIATAIDITPERKTKPETQAPQSKQPDIPASATVEQLEHIRQQLARAGMREDDLCQKLDLGAFAELKFDQVQPALDWIATVAP